jgi:deoxyribodipyrimidine photo-lyase
MEKFNIVWFKRDLRIFDHQPLFQAIQENNKIIPLYIIEPLLWQQPDLSKRQYQFLCESLIELNSELEKLGQKLIIKIGQAEEIISDLINKFNIEKVFSHQETWNFFTYQRDLKIKKLLAEKNISWFEYQQFGVFRKLKNRDGWAKRWQELMNQKIFSPPKKLAKINIESDKIISYQQLNLAEDNCTLRLKGGRSKALKILSSFLSNRGENYTFEMSSPNTAFKSCSLLSAYIAFGVISIKEILHQVNLKKIEVDKMPKELKKKWQSSLKSFSSRLSWHCHFIQKLEDQPEIEFENFHSIYDSIRNEEFNEEFYQSWKTGNTGFPFIDALMRCLIATGWINFRSRAILMSFASYHLWLPWQKTAKYLASLFIDYEPGIHFSQVQMQSATSGINAVRIYNPIKQSFDQDPKGVFIRKWVSELANLEDDFIHTPWLKSGFFSNYPKPIIDEEEARKNAAKKIYDLRKNQLYKSEAKKIFIKHGSRKSGLKKNIKDAAGIKKTKKIIRKKSENIQLDLF